MAKERSGYVFEDENKWFARLTFTDSNGKRRNVKRRAKDKTHAKLILRQLLREIEDFGSKSLEASQLTFNDLANFYAEKYLFPAQYVNGRKVAGLRDWKHARGFLNIFKEYFGTCKLREITYEHIRTFRIKRLNTPTQYKRPRTIITVNRELTFLRRLFNIAEREGWIFKNPFRNGDSLISLADEYKRDRILSREEESQLLKACAFPKRNHLCPIIICALDTGMRFGEILKLKWRDVDLETRTIIIQAFNTKTMRERKVSITIRLMIELEKLLNNSRGEPDSLVFGVVNNVRKSFGSACKEAKIEGLKIHDLRHTHATRLDDLGFSLAKIGGQLGHTQLQTTLRYVNRDKSSINQVANALDVFNSESIIEEAIELVN